MIKTHRLLFGLLITTSACDRPAEITAPRLNPASVISPSTDGIASGVFIESVPLGRPGMTAWDNWAKQVGGRTAYIMWYTDWSATFQGYAVTNAYSRGSIPVITWEMKNRTKAIPYRDVLSGKWNKYIDTWATAARTDGRDIFVRFGHEMNGDWYGWGGARNGGNEAAAQQFVAMWRYVHDRFQAKGVTNITWVWCPNHESVPNAAWNAPENYYPGDSYVDWTCADGYNWGTSQAWSSWRSFDEVFGPVYSRVTTVAPGKPFMIGEFASTELGGDKGAWIRDAASSISSGYPQLKAFIWFNMNKETDWRLESSASSLDAFRSAFVNDPVYLWK